MVLLKDRNLLFHQIQIKILYMYNLNNTMALFLLAFCFIGCSDDEVAMEGSEGGLYSMDCLSQCEAYNMECQGEVCLCSTDEYFRISLEDSLFCHSLNDSFYIRVDHEGDISNFEIMDVLKIPASESTNENSGASLRKQYPEQFIVDLFSTKSQQVEYKDYNSNLYISLLFDNKDVVNSSLPMRGLTGNIGPPSGYKGPKNTPGLTYGLGYEWDIEVEEDTAILRVKVYSAGEESLFLDDEITMYYERYRE